MVKFIKKFWLSIVIWIVVIYQMLSMYDFNLKELTGGSILLTVAALIVVVVVNLFWIKGRADVFLDFQPQAALL